MSWKSDLFVGLRNYRNYQRGRLSHRRLAGAVLGIAFSMLPVLVVLEVSGGMIEGITRRYVELSSFHLQAGTYQDYRELNLKGLIDRVGALEGIRQVTPFVHGQGLVYAPGGRMGVQVRGMSEDTYADDPEFRRYLQFDSGGFSFGEGEKGLLLSRGMAEELGVSAGDPVKLLVSRTSRSGRTILRPGNYTVTGIFSTGYHELDMFSVYMSYDRALEVFGDQGTVVLGLKTDDYTRPLHSLQKAVEDILPQAWYVLTWYDMERSLYQNLETTKTMLTFIMAVIILVAAVNISSSMLNLVMEKQEQIAVMKSMGAGPGEIKRQFLITGFLIGILGVLAGTVLGLSLAVNINQVIAFLERILNGLVTAGRELLHPQNSPAGEAITLLNPEYYLEQIPIRISPVDTVLVGCFTLLTCLAAAYFPARKAAGIKPLDVIRHH